MARVSLLVALLPALVGCASAAPAPPARPPLSSSAHPVVELPRVVVSPYSEADLAYQFEHGRDLLLTEDYEPAATTFERVARLAPDGELWAPSVYNAGIAREGLGEREAAADHYREVTVRFPDGPVAKGAQIRLARVLAYLERWGDLAAAADAVLVRKDLTPLEVIEARGHMGLSLVEQDRIDEAFKHVAMAMDVIEAHRFGEAGKAPLELAAANFALGEVRRKKSERITFVPMPPNFTDVLEQRCQGLLDAQSAYVEAMRSYDAHWSAMAGYRVGQLYQGLHRDVMQIPAPKGADTPQRKQLFEGAMRLRYRILLEKGMKMMDATLRIADRTGEASAWIGRAREAKRALELALEEEKAAMAKLPFSEAELQAGLDALRTKKP